MTTVRKLVAYCFNKALAYLLLQARQELSQPHQLLQHLWQLQLPCSQLPLPQLLPPCKVLNQVIAPRTYCKDEESLPLRQHVWSSAQTRNRNYTCVHYLNTVPKLSLDSARCDITDYSQTTVSFVKEKMSELLARRSRVKHFKGIASWGQGLST